MEYDLKEIYKIGNSEQKRTSSFSCKRGFFCLCVEKIEIFKISMKRVDGFAIEDLENTDGERVIPE